MKREKKKRRDARSRPVGYFSLLFSRGASTYVLRHVYALGYIAFACGYVAAIISPRSSERSPCIRERRRDDDNGDDARTHARTFDAEKSSRLSIEKIHLSSCRGRKFACVHVRSERTRCAAPRQVARFRCVWWSVRKDPGSIRSLDLEKDDSRTLFTVSRFSFPPPLSLLPAIARSSRGFSSRWNTVPVSFGFFHTLINA